MYKGVFVMNTNDIATAEEFTMAANVKNEDLSGATTENGVGVENMDLNELDNEPETTDSNLNAEDIETETDDLEATDEMNIDALDSDPAELPAEAIALATEEVSDGEESAESSTDSAPQTGSRRRSAPLSEMDQKAAEKLAEAIAEANAPTMPELRRKAREQIVENGGTVRRSHAEAIREARARGRERDARREERYESLALWNSLVVAQRRNIMQMGDVQAVEELNGQIVAILSLQGLRTIVPFSLFFLSDPIDYSTVTSQSDLRRRQTQMLTRTIGMRTPVTIAELMRDEDDIGASMVLANRKAALELLNQRTFGEGRNALREGDIAQGHITSVGNNALRVLVGGTEAQLPKFRATNRYIEDMRERFALNQPIDVQIRSIEKNEDGQYRLTIDARPPERLQMADNLEKIREDGRYIGYVTHIQQTPNGNIVYRLHLKMQDVAAVAYGIPTQYMQRPLQPGDAVVFRATSVNYEQGYAQGRILRLC